MDRIAPSLAALRSLRLCALGRGTSSRQCLRKPLSQCQPRHLPCPRRQFSHYRRKQSSISQTIHVDTSSAIPARNKQLHGLLSQISKSAQYVNIPQLSLALRGLESERPALRVGLLSFSGDITSRQRLVRLLLSDALTEETAWEEKLLSVGHNGKAILLKYNEVESVDTRHPLLDIWNIPAKQLLNHRLELFLYNVPNVGERLDDILLPILDIPSSNSGRTSLTAYPLHRAILIGQGLSSLRSISPMSGVGEELEKDDSLVQVTLDVPMERCDTLDVGKGIGLVNLGSAEKGLDAFRHDPDQALYWAEQTSNSGLSALRDDIFRKPEPNADSDAAESTLKSYIDHLLSQIILRIETEATKSQLSESDLNTRRTALLKSTAEWSEVAHTELRDELANAFDSPSWRKLTWWKLLWRVDDVTLYASDTIRRAFLIDTEKGAIWISARLEEALNPTRTFKALYEPKQPPREGQAASPGSWFSVPKTRYVPLSDPEAAAVLAANPNAKIRYFTPRYPWPTQIEETRDALFSTRIPQLQREAQGYLFSALSTTGLSIALAGLSYFSLLTGMYGALAIVSLGTVVPAWRLQRQWEWSRKVFVRDVGEVGRTTLLGMEGEMKRGINEAVDRKIEMGGGVASDRAEIEKVRSLVEEAREALEKLS